MPSYSPHASNIVHTPGRRTRWVAILPAAALVLGAPAAWAGPGEEICNRTSTESDRIECARIVGGRWVDEAAVSLCGRTSTSDDVVACARAVVGRAFESPAVDACGRTSTSADVVACAYAIADKTYTVDEIELCNGVSTSQGVVSCLDSTGRPLAPPPSQPAPTPPPRRDAPGVPVLLVNDSTLVVSRVFVRASAATRWPGPRWTGRLGTGDQVGLELASAGFWDVCLESGVGDSTWWPALDIRAEGVTLVLPERGATWTPIACADR